MPVNKRNVERLVSAAWRGIQEELSKENSSGEDVISAAMTIGSDGIKLALDPKFIQPEHMAINAAAIRKTLELMMLDTILDDGKVQ